MIAIGIALWLGLMIALVSALIAVVRAPFRALGVLVAGMALHNFAIMALIRLGTPTLLIRVIQVWKEALLLALLVLAARLVLPLLRTRQLPRLTAIDYMALAFTIVIALYAIMPRAIFPAEGTLKQMLVSLRALALLPLLYAFGRIFRPRMRDDLIWVCRAILGSAAVVGLFGLIELWFIPTSDWVRLGAIRFSQWLGYSYNGPSGLPANFFQSTASGNALRRMVSTYVSPLGIAYTGLLIVPLGAALLLLSRRAHRDGLPAWFRWGAMLLLVVSILLSVTRGALVSLVGEAVLLAILLPRPRIALGSALVIVATVLVLFEYQHIGPLVNYQLVDLREPAGLALLRDAKSSTLDALGRGRSNPTINGTATTSSGHNSGLVSRTLNLQDPSAHGHVAALKADLHYLRTHPAGSGLGSAVPRYGTTAGPGESALLTIGGELGVLGALLYSIFYVLTIVYGGLAFLRVRGDHMLAGFALVSLVGGLALLPIMITSSIWGDFSVTFLFWWSAGMAASLTAAPARVAEAGSVVDEASQDLAPRHAWIGQ